MIQGDYFITPHAVEQFQKRICPLDYEQALGAIIQGLTHDALPAKRLDSGKGVMVRVRGRWEFRAIIVAGDDKPAVATILKSGKSRSRK